MASTDEKQRRALIRFYRKRIEPLAAGGDADWMRCAPTDGDPSCYVSRPRTRMRPEDFDLRLADERQAAEALEQAWAGTPLEPLARKLVKLARHFPQSEQRSDLSSFIYEMF